jgi:hypothetical protein
MRIHNSGGAANRSGRTALFQNANDLPGSMNSRSRPAITFKIGFGPAGSDPQFRRCDGRCRGQPGRRGTAVDDAQRSTRSSMRCRRTAGPLHHFPGHAPQVLTWDGARHGRSTDYAELVLGGQKRTPFYRISPQGITLLPGARTGSGITLHASAPVFKPPMVGTRMRFIGRQMLITAVAHAGRDHDGHGGTLPGHQNLTLRVIRGRSSRSATS